jgi:hypothetical protein
VPAPATQADAEKRANSKEFDVKEWYLSTRKLEKPAKVA